MSASSGDSEADYWLWARLFMFLRDPTSDGYLKRFDAELKVPSAVRAIAASFVDEHVRDLALAEEEGDSRHPDEINAQGERRLRQAIVQGESGGGDVARLTALARELATGSASGRGWELWELVRAAKHRLDDLRASAPAAAALVEAMADYRRVILDLLPDESHDPDDRGWSWHWASLVERRLADDTWERLTAGFRTVPAAEQRIFISWLAATAGPFDAELERVMNADALAELWATGDGGAL
jgi:hypothetical protein